VLPWVAALPGSSRPPEQPAARKPKLVVVLVIDQLRADYLERFHDRFGPDGFNRLLREGAYFSSCYYPYGETLTAVGHATLATGTTPNRHGIVGNSLFDEKLGRILPAVMDEKYPAVGNGAKARPVSPRRIRGTTLAGELVKATEGKAKVFGVALKDRSAVFSTGRKATGAYWYEEATGHFITSRYYREELPEWVLQFNRSRGGDSYYGKSWQVEGRTVRALTTSSGEPDSRVRRMVRRTPHGNDMVLNFATELVEQENLGSDDATDFLFIGFSAVDYAGHDWGPYSPEMADMITQTDGHVARLLAFLDEEVGEGRYWLALSADHGVAPTPAQAWKLGKKAHLVERAAIDKAVREALEERWGKGPWIVPRSGKERVYFDRATLARLDVSVEEAAKVAGEAGSKIKGVLGYAARNSTNLPEEFAAAYQVSYFPGRSPDVIFLPKPYHIVRTGDTGGHHGTPHEYDQHVPLLFFGPVFQPGRYSRRVTPVDMAPTLAAALGVKAPSLATGEVLTEAVGSASDPETIEGKKE
jgi:arylsulfatase A-like enzyme